MSLYVFLACLVAVNTWVTVRVRRAAGMPHKGMHIAMTWIVPVLGAVIVLPQLPRYEAQHADGEPAPRKSGVLDAAPEQVGATGVEPYAFKARLLQPHGFPLPDWDAVDNWLATIHDGTARRDARLDTRRAWLLHLRDALGPHVSLHETSDAYVLSSLAEPVALATAKYVSTTRQRVERVLHGLAQFPPGEKSILLVLDDEETYYRYVAIYYPEDGEFAFSGGMFIKQGCPHFVLRSADLPSIEPTIAHELTHSALAHLQLPLWLDEGIAVNTERRLSNVGASLYTPLEMRDKHLQFWGPVEIQEFWSGASFFRTDDGNLLSYDLARLLVEQLGKSWESFQRFVAQARREDAGAAAAAEHLGVDLGAYVCALFEKTDPPAWKPLPAGTAIAGPA